MALVVWNPLCYRLNRQIHNSYLYLHQLLWMRQRICIHFLVVDFCFSEKNLILFAFAFDCLPFGVVDDTRQTNQHTALSLLNLVWF